MILTLGERLSSIKRLLPIAGVPSGGNLPSVGTLNLPQKFFLPLVMRFFNRSVFALTLILIRFLRASRLDVHPIGNNMNMGMIGILVAGNNCLMIGQSHMLKVMTTDSHLLLQTRAIILRPANRYVINRCPHLLLERSSLVDHLNFTRHFLGNI